jgi:alkanesulfonate monooxygenase SsuD/methylene tetrahydromethanopterin reductase-like flavin-dependent oxidoreductase (luciferase family)
VRVGISMTGAEALFDGDIGAVLELVSRADRRGVDLISTADHLGFNGSAHAARRDTHRFPFTLDQPWYEPIAFLSAAAAVTPQLRAHRQGRRRLGRQSR